MIHNHIKKINMVENNSVKLSPIGYTIKVVSKWFGFTGLYVAFSVCPVGIGSASIIGAVFVLFFRIGEFYIIL
ncbi:MAG: hypothetical protein WC644_02415 [Ignavibacteria bacterium]